MRKLSFGGLSSVVLAIAVVGLGQAGSGVAAGAGTAVQEASPPSADAMLEAWDSLVGTLDATQIEGMSFAFDADERMSWFYTPVDRTGLARGSLNDRQRERLEAFLTTGFGAEGLEKAIEIIALENYLYVTSGGRAMRDPGNYFLTSYGSPSGDGPWGWRFEGHHLSVSFTVADGRVVAGTPAFFGGNPATVPDDFAENPGMRVFDNEETMGRALVQSFTGAQRDEVIIAAEAPSDILTTNSATAEMGAPEGVAIADMSEEQRGMLFELVGHYMSRMHTDLANYQRAKIRMAGVERVHFAWAGGTEPGEGHYYRIQGPTFVVEYDNTQGGANHVHSAWRDFEDDFGRDPLRAHLAADHGLKIAGFGSDVALDSDDSPLGGVAEISDHDAAHRRAHAQGLEHAHRR